MQHRSVRAPQGRFVTLSDFQWLVLIASCLAAAVLVPASIWVRHFISHGIAFLP